MKEQPTEESLRKVSLKKAILTTGFCTIGAFFAGRLMSRNYSMEELIERKEKRDISILVGFMIVGSFISGYITGFNHGQKKLQRQVDELNIRTRWLEEKVESLMKGRSE